MLNGYNIFKNKLLGQGASSSVYLGRPNKYNNYENVAIKVIKLSKDKNFDYYEDEINIMEMLSHKNILKLIEYNHDSKSDILYIITEYCNIGNLEEIINKSKTNENRENIAKLYLNQLKNALKYIHSKNIIHRDIKPANVLVKGNIDNIESPDNIVKLADFGLSKIIEQEQSIKGTICGSPYFMSPELLSCSEYDVGVDIWAFGIILYEFLYDIPFIDVDNIYQLKRKIMTHEITFEKKYSSELSDFLESILQKNPVNRISGDKFYNHIWFNAVSSKTKPIKIPKKNDIYNRIFFNSLDEEIFDMS